jgi:hypothetical protein
MYMVSNVCWTGTTNHESAGCIELLALLELYDVIRDQGIIVEADQKIEERLEGDPSIVWWYLPGASELFCRGLLGVNDFQVQEAAAWRLGRFGSASAIESLQKLANTVVLRGRVDQHVRAAKRAVEQIRRLSSAMP